MKNAPSAPLLRYVKLSPAGNTTAIIADPVEPEARPRLAAALMKSLDVEQVGFYAPPQNRLNMMGGEFCGNAARCFAAWLAMGGQGLWVNGPLAITASRTLAVEISGHCGPLRAAVAGGPDGRGIAVSIEMPLPLSIAHGQHSGIGHYSSVAFEGITHVVLWDTGPDEGALAAAKALAGHIGIDKGDYGLMFADPGRRSLTPWVHVAHVGSEVWESSCGSGSVAVACALADRAGRPVDGIALEQPGGTLSVTVGMEGQKITVAVLAGLIELVSYGYVSAV